MSTPARPRRRIVVLLAVAVIVLVADIVTKVVVVATLSDRAPVSLLGGFLTLRVTRNPGAAFSIGPSLTIVFAVIAVGVIVFILRTSRRIQSLAWAVTLGLLLGGATGNLTDRLLRYPGPFRGYVVDWIEIPHWPVFNIADSCIVCGGVLAVFLAVRGVRIDASTASQEAGQPPPGAPRPPAAAPGEEAGGTSGPGIPGRPDASETPHAPDASDGPGSGDPGGGGRA